MRGGRAQFDKGRELEKITEESTVQMSSVYPHGNLRASGISDNALRVEIEKKDMVSSLCDSCCAKPTKIKNGGSLTSRNSMNNLLKDLEAQENTKSVLKPAERMNQSTLLNENKRSPLHWRSAERREEAGKD